VSVESALTSTSRWQSLLCRVGEWLLAVPLPIVVETMRPLPVERLPDLPEFIPGVSVIRGVAVPVVDVSVLLAVAGSPPTRFLTLALDERRVALAVDAVIGVRWLDAEVRQELPPLLGGVAPELISAIGTLDPELLVVLGDAQLVPESAWDTIKARATREAGVVPEVKAEGS
jgi:purine-binding chemotaxis protein CheW